MVVPVRRWANTALFGLVKSEPRSEVKAVTETSNRRDGLLVSFEKMLAAHTDQVIRGITE